MMAGRKAEKWGGIFGCNNKAAEINMALKKHSPLVLPSVLTAAVCTQEDRPRWKTKRMEPSDTKERNLTGS